MIPPMTETDEQEPGNRLAAAGYTLAGLGILIGAVLLLGYLLVWVLLPGLSGD
jgi:hypothetical protein